MKITIKVTTEQWWPICMARELHVTLIVGSCGSQIISITLNKKKKERK